MNNYGRGGRRWRIDEGKNKKPTFVKVLAF
jgi:hypothetical protein